MSTQTINTWTPEEHRLKQRLLEGKTVVANGRKGVHPNLIEWAKSEGKLLYVGRYSPGWGASRWKNPFVVGEDGTREEVCDLYQDYLLNNEKLLTQIPELKGKVLLCWCSPERCHADFLAKLANQA